MTLPKKASDDRYVRRATRTAIESERITKCLFTISVKFAYGRVLNEKLEKDESMVYNSLICKRVERIL